MESPALVDHWSCSCGMQFKHGRDLFQHRGECDGISGPVAVMDLPLKRVTGIERMEAEDANS